MEIEKKFRIEAMPEELGTRTDLTQIALPAGYHLRTDRSSQQQANHFFDTADGRLAAAGHALRIRDVAGRRKITLKSAGEVHDGLFRRGEWEVLADLPDPASWPTSEARERALALVRGAPLLPLFTIHTERHIYAAVRDQRDVAELSVDRGSVQVGAQTDQFFELEIELLPAGSEADIDALEQALRAVLPLVPEDRTKFDRGMRLLQAAREVEQ